MRGVPLSELVAMIERGMEPTPLKCDVEEQLAALVARVRLEEAKWWHMQRGHHGANWCCERIDALKLATASKAAGGGDHGSKS